MSNPFPMTWLSSTTSPLFNAHSASAVDPATLFTRNSNTPRAAASFGGDAMAKNEGFGASGTRSWRYCPASVCDAARSGASETSMAM